METVRDISTLRTRIRAMREGGQQVALVPTMGALHQGHLPLVFMGRQHGRRVVTSIFVNPKQFGANEDLGRYPRTEASDVRLLEAAGCDLLFAPTVEEVYPNGFATSVHVGGLGETMEGTSRPGHFDGVTTVVAKLLLMTMPDVALFGEKDWQQLQLIRRMVVDLDLPVEILSVPIARDHDGLALSSRNAFLSAEDRRTAALLPQTLAEATEALGRGDDPTTVLATARQRLRDAGFKLDYLTLADGATLTPLDRPQPHARLFVAAGLGTTRLIDNMSVPSNEQV